jgi:two-component system, cell cycle sensor histidine kinase and response regulator CckA
MQHVQRLPMLDPGPRLWFLAAGALLLGLHAVVDLPVLRAVIYVTIGAAALASVGRAHLRKGPASGAWGWVGLGLLFWVVGDVSWYLADLTEGVGYPSVSDGLYLVGYPLLAVGPLALALSGRARRGFGVDLIDATIIALSAALLVWPFVFQPTIDLGWGKASAVTMVYSAGDLVLFALLTALLFNTARRSRPVTLLAAAMLAIFTADSLTYVAQFTPTVPSEAVTQMWLVGYLLIGIAALDPRPVVGSPSGRNRSPVLRLVAVGIALLAIPAAIVVHGVAEDGGAAHWTVTVPIVTLIIALVVIRGVTLVREISRFSERAESARQRLSTVLDTAGVGILFRDTELMTESNVAFQQMLGYSSEELATMSYLDVIHPDEREEARAIPRVEAGTRKGFMRRFVGKTGDTVEAHVILTATLDGLSVAVIEDVTARRRLERQLSESQKLEAVARLAGGIAHDFNNLLTAVCGHAELLRYGDNSPEDEESIEVILESAAKAATLTRKLLAFSRTHEVAPEPIEITQIVQSAVELLGRMIPSDIQVEARVDARSPAIFADPTQIDQMLFNLAVNARDAMPNGGRLTFEVDRWTTGDDGRFAGAAPGAYCLITVTDTGTGMDAATRSHIFEPYFTTKAPGKGTGLGLSMIHGIVVSSGGHINVESEPGRGTAFEIIFPACVGGLVTDEGQLVAA